jgi:hypothetical protein
MGKKSISKSSIPTYGFKGLIYDSEHEAMTSLILGDSVKYLGGSPKRTTVAIAGQLVHRPPNPNHRSISCIDKYGNVFKTIPDFELVKHPNIFIEAKGNLDKRSRRNIEGLLRHGFEIGVVFVSEKAANQKLWTGANITKGQWLKNKNIPYVTNASDAQKLIQLLDNSQEAI